MLVEWKEEYSIGIPGVDHEHRELIDLINQSAEVIETVDVSDVDYKNSLRDSLGEIHSKIASHFALEEKEMKGRKYPAANPHKIDHETLLDALLDIMDDVDRISPAALRDDLGRRLQSWFLGHFREFDAPFHHFLEPR